MGYSGTGHITSTRMNLAKKSHPRDRIDIQKIKRRYSKTKKQLSKSELAKIKALEKNSDRIKFQKIAFQILSVSLAVVAIYWILS